MFRFPDNFFFRPNQSIEPLLPLFIGLGMALLIIVITSCMVYFYNQSRLRTREELRFRHLAERYGLNPKERWVLGTLADWTHVEKKSQLLNNAERFERVLRMMEHRGYFARRTLRKHKRTIEYIRTKLFGREISPSDPVTSSLQLRAGTRLFMRYLDFAETVVWGHLIDVDRDGLIVVVPLNRELRIPLRKETHLEITAYVPNHNPVSFLTVVKNVIPGPRRMVVLEHSNNLIARNPKSPSFQHQIYSIPGMGHPLTA